MTASTMSVPAGGIRLLNASYEVLNENYRPNKAARLLALGKAVIEEADETRTFGQWLYPKVLRLVKFVQISYDKLHGPPRVSKRGVLIRDNRTCAYCGDHATTIDHVHPRSKGGKNTWQNMVAACLKCNHKKGSRTLEECGMTLQWKGYVPKRTQLR